MEKRFSFGENPAGAVSGRIRGQYHALQSLLGENSLLLEIMADLEADLRFLPAGSLTLHHQVGSLLDGALLMIEDLNWLTSGRYQSLYTAFRRIEAGMIEVLRGTHGSTAAWVVELADVGLAQTAAVGGKAARLGELHRVLSDHVPEGFVVTADAYHQWMRDAHLSSEIRSLLETLEVSSDPARFQSKAGRIREIVMSTPLPAPIQDAIEKRVSQAGPDCPNWAVRSSAVGEDGALSFAGQFESVLNVPGPRIPEAYKMVVASRFSDRAISYRLLGGFTEAATPMAVLCIPTIEAMASGVLYTRDPNRPEDDRILISSTWGLAGDLVGGSASGDTITVSRQQPGKLIEARAALKKTRLIPGVPMQTRRVENSPPDEEALSQTAEDSLRLAELGLRIENHFAGPQDIEWAQDDQGRIWILQARPLHMTPTREAHGGRIDLPPILTAGLTIFPGRAIAPVFVAGNAGEFVQAPEGAILVVPAATPELAAALPRLAGFIAEQGHPTGHAATLLREFAIPSVFDAPGATKRLSSGMLIGLDATHRQVFEGAPWPDVRERTLSRLAGPKEPAAPNPLSELILSLRMTDPQSREFRPEKCASVHDLIRFVHEKGVAAFFEIGDQEARRRGSATRKLTTAVPLNIFVQDLGNALSAGALDKKEIHPDDIRSIPFRALWSGVTDPRVSWAGRRQVNLKGFASVMASSLGQEAGTMRRLGDPNYLLVGSDYMNLNIRLAYHYAMVDSLVGPVTETNYVNFRFRGGGGSRPRLDLRARFLAEVLLRHRFMVDRRGDLVTAWLRRYPQQASEEALTMLGRLMGCARQLDMLMENESVVSHFVELFCAGNYEDFA